MGARATKFWLQLRLLLWKNFILQIRRPKGTIVELLLPTFAIVVLIILRQLVNPKDKCFQSCRDYDPHYQASIANVKNSSAPMVGFYPDTNLTRAIMETMSCLSAGYKLKYNKRPFYGEPLQISGFNSAALLETEAAASDTQFLGAITFDNINASSKSLPKKVSYSIRLKPESSGGENRDGDSWRTRRDFAQFEEQGIFNYVYYRLTFTPLKRMIDQAIIRLQVEKATTTGQCRRQTSQCPALINQKTVCHVNYGLKPDDKVLVIPFPSDLNETTARYNNSALSCNCTRLPQPVNGSSFVSYTATCTCNPGDIKGLDIDCETTADVNTTCCGRCEGSAMIKTFVPTVTKHFPFPKYTKDTFIVLVSFMFGLLIVLTLIYSAGMIVKELVLEKQSRMRESMKMMGLSSKINWLAWFIKQFVFFFFSVVMATILLKAGKVFEHSDGGLLFIFMLLYFLTSIFFLFCLSTFFSNARIAMLNGFVLWFVSYVPFLASSANYDNMNNNDKAALCLLPNSCLGLIMVQYARREQSTEGVSWSNYNSGPTVADDFNVNLAFGMLIVDSLIFVLVGWYMENVFPGEYGIPQPWYFFATKSYWLGVEDSSTDDCKAINKDNYDASNHEEEPTGLEVGIAIRDLCKTYYTGNAVKVAVNGLSLNMYSGQITSLLGHNGAGKTTTMSMLVGLFPPSGGDAQINGHSIRKEMPKIRESLGLCPQHNVLFDQLTVEEHLRFFMALKTGRSGPEVENEIAAMLVDLQLTDKRDWMSRELSGGMKRKLSVAIALIGGSKIVILDEPTAGMDPYARRATWDLLLKHKEGRTMLLTTHFMDEADLLGDRVAIMAHGQLMCSGSSLFLKGRFGVGYHMTLVKDGENCNKKEVTSFIGQFITGSRLVSDAGAELAFVLPKEESGNFEKLFVELENRSKEFGISSFGVSVTTMEEVFISVGEAAEISLEKKLERRASVLSRRSRVESTSSEGEQRAPPIERMQSFEGMDMTSNLLQGKALWLQQFKAMFIKRFLTSIRHRQSLILQLLLPLIFTICALLILKLVPVNRADPSLLLSINRLGRTSAYVADFRDNTNLPSPLSKDYFKDVDVTLSDIRNESIGLDGTQRSDCCVPYFFLNKRCIQKRYSEMHSFGSCGKQFGYKHCLSCLDTSNSSGNMLRFSGNCESDDCPAVPTLPNANRRATLFQQRVLSKSNTGDYFKKWASGYSLHSSDDDLPDAIRDGQDFATAQCWISYFVNCNNITEDAKNNTRKNCTSWRENPSCLQEAYDPERMNMYVRVWWSSKAIHGEIYAVAAWSNAQLRFLLKQNEVADFDKYSIETANFPLPKSIEDQVDAVNGNGAGVSFGIIVTLGMAFLTASFAFVPVEEKASKAKHIQFVSGVDATSYWVANWAWDMCNFFLPLILLLIVFAAFDIPAFRGDALGVIFLMLLLFGWSSVPLSYCLSFLFSSPLIAYGVISFFLFIFGLAFVITLFALDIVKNQDSAQDALRHIFYFLPHFCLARGLSDIHSNHEKQEVCDKVPRAADIDLSEGFQYTRETCYRVNKVRTDLLDVDAPAVGTEVIYMVFTGFLYFILVMLIEKRFFIDKCRGEEGSAHPANLQPTDGEDEDVAEERARVEAVSSSSEADVVLLKNLTKVYNNKLGRPAADNLCLGIPSGECFGLLGVNGAGKTTTFNMLTGDVPPTWGTAYLKGFNIRTQLREVQQRIGYCPQFDALLERLTAKEVLTLYARLRGIPEARISGIVGEAVKKLNLDKWADRLCGTYSGGNKRKLSTAVALVGDPPIVFLDEPTTGMDPAARRFLWDVLTSVMRGGRSIVLTSHSMEECEALCTRLAIMVNGQFKCLGSIQHLKTRFGDGYTLSAKVQPPEAGQKADTSAVEEFVKATMPTAELLDSHHGQLEYQINGSGLTWSYIFGEMERNRDKLGIIDYSVSQTSLEQVFLNFARKQFS